ncbi:MAG: RagB/SusD family nutrient uptake outer membrane protein [Paludibacter sp.]|nr:RagB/SusD family nutrient uptake outer membrane protein [Paludibacter sp.]
MKTLKKTILGLILILLPACDLLDLKPIDTYSIDNYWDTKDQVSRFFTGLHKRVRDRQFVYMQLGEFRGGLLNPSPTSVLGQTKSDVDIIGNQLSLENPGVTNFGNFYMDIMQVNHAIERLNNYVTCLTEDEKNYYLGIAHGIRSYFYFHLLRSWGGVPVVSEPEVLTGVSTPTALNKERSTEQATMDFIKSDILQSETYLNKEAFSYNSKFGKSFWSKAATLTLKADIYLWSAKVKPIGSTSVYSENPEADIEIARLSLTSVWNATGILPNDFAGIFDYNNKENDEIIFAIPFIVNEKSNSFALFTYPASTFSGYKNASGITLDNPLSVGTDGGSRYEYLWSFFESISATDKRKAATFQDFYKGSIKGTYLQKFKGTMDGTIRWFADDWPVYRTADVALMLAECYNAQNNPAGVKTYIDLIRRRAYGRTYPEFTYVDKETSEMAILREYAIEFIAEGKYWYHLRRMNNGSEALKLVKNNDPIFLLWPIDVSTMSKDPLLEQNEAYKN